MFMLNVNRMFEKYINCVPSVGEIFPRTQAISGMYIGLWNDVPRNVPKLAHRAAPRHTTIAVRNGTTPKDVLHPEPHPTIDICNLRQV